GGPRLDVKRALQVPRGRRVPPRGQARCAVHVEGAWPPFYVRAAREARAGQLAFDPEAAGLDHRPAAAAESPRLESATPAAALLSIPGHPDLFGLEPDRDLARLDGHVPALDLET